MSEQLEQSFGIIPLQQRDLQWSALLICQRGCWGFPKGHPLEGELARQTAERELNEETGLLVSQFLPSVSLCEIYTYKRGGEEVKKCVEYFPALVDGTLVLQIDEVENGNWHPVNQVRDRLNFDSARRIWDRVVEQHFSS